MTRFPKDAILLAIYLVILTFTISCNSTSQTSSILQKNDVSQRSFTEYTARGNEPFWMVKIEADTITFRTPEEEITYPTTKVNKEDGGAIIFETSHINDKNAESNLRVVIVPKPCTDTMSGEAFPYTATVERDGKLYNGCAK